MNKQYRHGQILRLIKTHRIQTQESLAKELDAMGVHTTQVTLSRDMRELGLVKTADGYRQVEHAAAGREIGSVASELLLQATAAQNLLVLKTSPGYASVLAVALDQQDWPEIVGTIAGDDTVLVVTPQKRTAEAVRHRLLSFLEK